MGKVSHRPRGAPCCGRPQPFPPCSCAFLTLRNDRLSGEHRSFPLLPFLLASFTGDARTLGLLAALLRPGQFLFTPLDTAPSRSLPAVTADHPPA